MSEPIPVEKVPTIYSELLGQLRASDNPLCHSAAAVIERLEFRALGYAGRLATFAELLDKYESALNRILISPGDIERLKEIARKAVTNQTQP
jgi:hypothetical protein